MDREQPHRVTALFLRDRLELTCTDRLLVAHEADEALDVRSPQLFVRAGEARQLPQVRVTSPPVPPRKHGEVIVVLRQAALTEPLERQPRRRRSQPVVALAKR